MKEIIFIRHAKVAIDNSKTIYAKELKSWVSEYDTAALEVESLPTKEVRQKVKNADIVVTSTLSRAIDSAKVLGVSIDKKNSIFNEALVPVYNIPLLKLKPKSWLVILRVLLLVGLGKKDTSLKASKLQAKIATEELLVLSESHKKLVLVGHGGMNWLIQKVLHSKGWKVQGKATHHNFGMTILNDRKLVHGDN